MRRAAALPLVLLAGACAANAGQAPSLALRPAELRGFEEPVRAHPAVTADPALDAQVADAAKRLDELVGNFDTNAAAATRAAAAPGARTVGGEAWLSAQAALAMLDDRRAQVSALTAELDERARERTTQSGAPYPTLDALAARATVEGERESAVIATVAGSLPRP